MSARSNSKKSTKTQRGKGRKPLSKQTMDEPIITIHASEDDRSIISDVAEENQPIMDTKPNNTSTPKRKAVTDQTHPKKKLILENNKTNIDAIDNEIEEIKEITPKENKEARPQVDAEFQNRLEVLLIDLTRRMDVLEKGKRREDEEKLLSSTTQEVQVPDPKQGKVSEDTEDSSSDSSSDEEENDALEASRQECNELKEEVEKQKRNNEVAVGLLEKWKEEKTNLTQALADMERDYLRASDETDWNMQEIKRLEKELKQLKSTANHSIKLTEEKVMGYERKIKDLETELDAKSERLRDVERSNSRLMARNSELECSNKRQKAAVRTLREEAQRDHLMRKQIFDTPRIDDIPYFEEFEARDKKKGHVCNKKNCIVGGKKWLEFEKEHGIKITSYETHLKHINDHALEHWVKFQVLKELILSNKNQARRKDWEEIVMEYNSVGELGNHGIDLTELSIMNTSQVEKTRMGIRENDWVIDTVCNLYDKVMLAAIQICGLKDPETKTNVDVKDGEDIVKVWEEGRRLLMKGKEIRNSERIPVPGCSVYRRKHQKSDGTDLTTAYQRAERDVGEK